MIENQMMTITDLLEQLRTRDAYFKRRKEEGKTREKNPQELDGSGKNKTYLWKGRLLLDPWIIVPGSRWDLLPPGTLTRRSRTAK